MAKKSLANMLHKPVHPVIAISVSLCVVLLIGASPFITRALSRVDFSFTPPPKITYVNITPLPNITSTPNVPTVTYTQNTFTSPDLGISFEYIPAYNQPIHVQEVGNRVYLNVPGNEPPSGKFVEVFSKNSSDSLADAVKKQFLQGYSATDCYVKYGVPYWPYQPDYATATISYPGYNGTDIPNPNAAKCPAIYTQINGASYFAMDKNHPNKFVFFNIGQDNILGQSPTANGRTITWDQTLRFTGN